MEKIAEGVWIIRGGFPRRVFNVYLIEHADSRSEQGGQGEALDLTGGSLRGLTVFDAGARQMTNAILRAAVRIGRPIKRIVLSHAHPDHRGSARPLAQATGAAVWCHVDERDDVERDGGVYYWDYGKLRLYESLVMRLLFKLWDAGPVQVDKTLEDGDKVADFTVHHLPGHTPGLIALLRDRDGFCLASDALYTINPGSGSDVSPRAPHAAYSKDIARARESIRKLAGLEPSTVWLGHGKPLCKNVKQELLAAAER